MMTFEQIYGQTYRYAHTIVHRSLESETDDGLQVAYLRLWQRLTDDPNLLVDRPIAWIGRFLWNSAQRTAKSPKREIAVDPTTIRTGHKKGQPAETLQADTRIDIMRAITASAEHILAMPEGKKRDRALFALYSITALQIHVTASGRLWQVNHRAMREAYDIAIALLQHQLANYAPPHPTTPQHNRGQKEKPKQDMTQIRKDNQQIMDSSHIRAVREHLQQVQPDTLERDLIALEGIESGISARKQGSQHGISGSAIQRAYERVHLLLATQHDDTVVPRQIEKKRMATFTLTPDIEPLLKQVAHELVQEENHIALIALYSYICNLPNRAVSRDFQVNEGTLRRYRHQMQARFTVEELDQKAG